MTTYRDTGHRGDTVQDSHATDSEHAAWLEKWAPTCPIGNPQRVRACVGYREREPGRLQLRVPLTLDEGICEVIIEERDSEILVRVLVCYQEDDRVDECNPDYVSCPVHVYTERPLGDRAVIDVETEEVLPLFLPQW